MLRKLSTKLLFLTAILSSQAYGAENFCSPYLEYAKELNRFAQKAEQAGIAPQEMVEEYKEIAAPILDCELYGSPIMTVEEAEENLTLIRGRYQAGLASDVEVKSAEYKLATSNFCAESTKFLDFLVRSHRLREQAGLESVTATVGFLRKAANLVSVCTR